MQQTQHSSHRLLLVGIAAVVGLIIIISAVAFLLVGSTKRSTDSVNNTESKTRVATHEDVKKDLAELDDSLEQFAVDQAAAKTVLQDGQNQVKVGD